MASYIEATQTAEVEVHHERITEVVEWLIAAISAAFSKVIEENRRGKAVGRRLAAARDGYLIKEMDYGQGSL